MIKTKAAHRKIIPVRRFIVLFCVFLILYPILTQIRISPRANADSDKVGGDEENRTPVRRPPTKAFYECSRCFNVPSAQRPSAGSVHQ